MTQSTLIADVEEFLERHQIAPTKFGEQALGDKHFVRQLRHGRRVWPQTEGKVRKFMAEYGVAPMATSAGEGRPFTSLPA